VTETAVYFCPECGSPSIERSLLDGGTASCRACSWAGPASRLAGMPISHKFGGDAELIVSLVGDLRTILARDVGVTLVKYLQKWGFFTNESDRQLTARQAGRYMSAAARGIITAVLEERDKMEVERARGS
jgi:hypothetical protein